MSTLVLVARSMSTVSWTSVAGLFAMMTLDQTLQVLIDWMVDQTLVRAEGREADAGILCFSFAILCCSFASHDDVRASWLCVSPLEANVTLGPRLSLVA
jgi:hypothetical protein